MMYIIYDVYYDLYRKASTKQTDHHLSEVLIAATLLLIYLYTYLLIHIKQNLLKVLKYHVGLLLFTFYKYLKSSWSASHEEKNKLLVDPFSCILMCLPLKYKRSTISPKMGGSASFKIFER